MARYKYANHLVLSKNASFDLDLHPSSFAPCAGIYRCTGCGTEIAIEHGVLPDRTHHKHTPAQGEFWWRLIIATIATHPQPYLHGSA